MASNIASPIEGLTSAAQIQETTMMIMKPNANWELYLTPAPLSILLMAELVFISSGTDFSINKNPPQDGFKYIKYPDSFRASLTQMAHLSWHAFNEAHNNMDRIRIHTASIPNYMKVVLKILLHNSDEVIKTLLPNQLENIRTIADDCVTLASNVRERYSDVINFIHELMGACVSTHHVHVEELEQVKRKLEEFTLREKTAQNMNEQSKKLMEATSKYFDEAQHEYRTAMNSLPTGWEMIGMDLAEGLASTLTALLHGVTSVITDQQNKGPTADPPPSSARGPTFQNTHNEKVDIFKLTKILSKSEEILTVVQHLKQYANKTGIDWKELYDQKNNITKTTWTQSQFKRIYENLKDVAEGKLGEHVMSLCKRGSSICNELAEYSPEKPWDAGKTEKLVKDVEELYVDALVFNSQSKQTLGSPAQEAIPPNQPRAERSSGGSASQRATENARYRIEMSQDQLRQARESYEKSVKDMEMNQKELTEILVEIQNCNIKEIDFKTTIKMLTKGLDAMGKVKLQWDKMVLFFQMVSNIVDISLKKTLQNFVTTSDSTMKLSYKDKLFTKHLLYNQAFEASSIATLVHMIAGTYTEVSNKYLLDKVSSLGMLIGMDKNKPEFLQERLKLEESCKEAQEGIHQLVLKNKKEYDMKTSVRLAEIEGGLKALLSDAAPPEAKPKNIEDGLDKEKHSPAGVDDARKTEL